MGGSDASIRSPPGISGAGHPARIYPEAGQAGEAPIGRSNFKVGMRTEKSRLRRSLMSLQDLMRRMRHWPVREQVNNLNVVLRGHYAYYGIAGTFRALQKVHRAVERYWHKMLCSRSWAGRITWDVFHQIKQRLPLLRPKLYLPYRELQALAAL